MTIHKKRPFFQNHRHRHFPNKRFKHSHSYNKNYPKQSHKTHYHRKNSFKNSKKPIKTKNEKTKSQD